MTEATANQFSIETEFDNFMTDSLGLDPANTGGSIKFSGSDPIFESRHRIGACIGVPLMAVAASAATIWKMRTGRGQDLSLDIRKAIHGVNPVYQFDPNINGYPYQMPFAAGNPVIFGVYRTNDDRWYLPTGGYPHMLNDWCTFLDCAPSKEAFTEAIAKWDGVELDDVAAEKDLIGALCRTPEEWKVHPEGIHLAGKPIVEIVKVGDSDPEPFPESARPLSDIRVMAATHVIAGNVIARTLAEHGADVLHLARPQEFEHEILYVEPCVGFRSCWLDLNQQRDKAIELAKDADVFVESYRGHSMRNLGVGPEELAKHRPGIIYASGRCYSYDGPWQDRGGFDMEALCVTGFTAREGSEDAPKFPPTQVMNDFIAGYFGAAGVQAALIRRAREGGSYHVRVNLARFAMWYQSFGTFTDEEVQNASGPEHELRDPDALTAQTVYGELKRLAPPVEYSETKPYWEDPLLTVRGSCKPEWNS